MPPKNPKVKKVVPSLRGEKWRLSDHSEVIVLERMRGGMVRCFGPNGFTKVRHMNVFKERLA
jgi:hypothetical protein